MKVNEEQLEYIKGNKFSPDYHFKINAKYRAKTRIEKILELTKNKKVLHLGCCDHIPLIKNKIKENIWLHKLLTENCTKVLGLDINIEAINYIKEEIKFNNLEYCDITQSGNKNILNEKWDYIVIGEILEHVDNPVDFLKKIVENYGKNIDKMIITVPNALCRGIIKYSEKTKGECNNSDHRYYFTPLTILKVANNAGLENFNIYYTNLFVMSILPKIKNKINKILKKEIFKFDFLDFNTLILEARIKR